jgi:hypothetical protein
VIAKSDGMSAERESSVKLLQDQKHIRDTILEISC